MIRRIWIDSRAILQIMTIPSTWITMIRMCYYSLQIVIVYVHVVQAEGNYMQLVMCLLSAECQRTGNSSHKTSKTEMKYRIRYHKIIFLTEWTVS